MNYLNLDTFVTSEVFPEINNLVQNYLESEYSYIENEDDLSDLENAEVTDDLFDEIESDLYKMAKELKDEYDFSYVNEKVFPREELLSMIESSFSDCKEIMMQEYLEQFEKQEYFDEYYSGEDY